MVPERPISANPGFTSNPRLCCSLLGEVFPRHARREKRLLPANRLFSRREKRTETFFLSLSIPSSQFSLTVHQRLASKECFGFTFKRRQRGRLSLVCMPLPPLAGFILWSRPELQFPATLLNSQLNISLQLRFLILFIRNIWIT